MGLDLVFWQSCCTCSNNIPNFIRNDHIRHWSSEFATCSVSRLRTHAPISPTGTCLPLHDLSGIINAVLALKLDPENHDDVQFMSLS